MDLGLREHSGIDIDVVHRAKEKATVAAVIFTENEIGVQYLYRVGNYGIVGCRGYSVDEYSPIDAVPN